MVYSFMQVNLIVSGLSYGGKDENGKDRWDEIALEDPRLEWPGYHLRQRISMWSIHATLFFRRYVYNRFLCSTGS